MTHEPARYRDGENLPAAYDEAVAEEAWTACRQLLDAAQPDFAAAVGDPAVLADRVYQRIVRRRKRRRRLSLAAAAMLLGCGGAVWFAAGRPAEQVDPEPRVALAEPADWDDEGLDLELAWTMYQADAIESQWRRPVDNLAFVRQQMDALEAEFEDDSL